MNKSSTTLPISASLVDHALASLTGAFESQSQKTPLFRPSIRDRIDKLASESSAPTEKDASLNVCRSWNYRDYILRLMSFRRTYYWFAKPVGFSPTTCARFGWCNTNRDELMCLICHQKFQFEEVKHSKSHAEIVLTEHHDKLCAWRDNPCPASFADFPQKSFEDIRGDFLDRLRGILVVLLEWSGSHTGSLQIALSDFDPLFWENAIPISLLDNADVTSKPVMTLWAGVRQKCLEAEKQQVGSVKVPCSQVIKKCLVSTLQDCRGAFIAGRSLPVRESVSLAKGTDPCVGHSESPVGKLISYVYGAVMKHVESTMSPSSHTNSNSDEVNGVDDEHEATKALMAKTLYMAFLLSLSGWSADVKTTLAQADKLDTLLGGRQSLDSMTSPSKGPSGSDSRLVCPMCARIFDISYFASNIQDINPPTGRTCTVPLSSPAQTSKVASNQKGTKGTRQLDPLAQHRSSCPWVRVNVPESSGKSTSTPINGIDKMVNADVEQIQVDGVLQTGSDNKADIGVSTDGGVQKTSGNLLEGDGSTAQPGWVVYANELCSLSLGISSDGFTPTGPTTPGKSASSTSPSALRKRKGTPGRTDGSTDPEAGTHSIKALLGTPSRVSQSQAAVTPASAFKKIRAILDVAAEDIAKTII